MTDFASFFSATTPEDSKRITAGVAKALANQGHKVLVVDANFASPGVCDFLNIDRRDTSLSKPLAGLFEICGLIDIARKDQAAAHTHYVLDRYIVGIEGIDCLPASVDENWVQEIAAADFTRFFDCRGDVLCQRAGSNMKCNTVQ